MLDQTIIELSKYRLEKSQEMLIAAERDYQSEDYSSANNRAYYCIFHAMRAIMALDGEDYKKHSAVIARFTQNYLKTGQLSREYSTLITNASLIRNRSDYEDFYICSIDDTKKLIDGANLFLQDVQSFIQAKANNNE